MNIYIVADYESSYRAFTTEAEAEKCREDYGVDNHYIIDLPVETTFIAPKRSKDPQLDALHALRRVMGDDDDKLKDVDRAIRVREDELNLDEITEGELLG